MAKRVAVVGAGVIGLATAWAMEQRGITCAVYEQGAPGGEQSAGESRIFRHAHNDPRQFELALRARRDWREWEAVFGDRLVSEDGVIALGTDAIARLHKYIDEPGVLISEVKPGAANAAMPLLSRYAGPALLDETAGAINTRLTLANLIRAIGVNLLPERVETVTPRPDGGVEVVSDFGTRTFDAVVVAAGIGTADLARQVGIGIPVISSAITRLTVPVVDPDPRHPLPCIQDSSGAFGELAAYGSPVPGNREYTVGLAVTAGISPGETQAHQLDQLTARTIEYVAKAMPGLDARRAAVFHRRVTELPWATDGLAVWQEGDAFYIAGHNLFKLAPALGKMLVRSVEAGTVEPGFRPSDQLGVPVSERAGSAG